MHHKQLQVWADNCPENFENRAALVGAEIARVEGRTLDAMELYEQAIRSARANGFVHNEAIAYEVAARFYATCGFDQFADVYLRNARYCYLRWGADGKVRQLDEHNPHLRQERDSASSTATIGTPVAQLNVDCSQGLTSAVERNCAAQVNRDACGSRLSMQEPSEVSLSSSEKVSHRSRPRLSPAMKGLRSQFGGRPSPHLIFPNPRFIMSCELGSA